MKYPLILIGLSSGFGLTVLGNTHYALEDMGLMRNIPGMSIASPANELQAVEAFQEAIVHDGPVYIRLNGFRETQLPAEYTESVLQEGDDINIITCGSMAYNTLKAAEILKAKGINTRVYNCKTIQPLPDEAIVKDCPLTVTVEEHRVTGGLGDAVASEIATTYGGKLLKIGVQEDFPEPGSYKHLLQISGLTPEAIAERIETKLNNLNNI